MRGQGGHDVDSYKSAWRERRASNRPEDVSKVFRYRELLPFDAEVYDRNRFVTIAEGNHPLIEVPRSAEYAGVDKLRVMHEGVGNPTGSFKDLGMCVAITQAALQGYESVGAASTGNTATSMSAYARRAGMKSIVLVPSEHLAFGKLSQILDFGAKAILVNGNFDAAQRFLRELAEQFGIAIMNSVNPYRAEGQKTAVADMYEQLDWQNVDRIVLPLGNGGNTRALYKALRELRELGFIKRIPRITSVQAAYANPIERMYKGHLVELVPQKKPHTKASAINIGEPANWRFVREAIDATDGWVTSVTEKEIADAKAVIGLDGIGCEPASAAPLAGLRKLRMARKSEDGPDISHDENIVLVLTGNQLKDPDYTTGYHKDELYDDCGHKLSGRFSNRPFEAEADRDSIARMLEKAMAS